MSTHVPGAAQRIVAAATAWSGVAAAPGSRGELSLRVGHRELGHLHGDHAAYFSFTKRIGSELRAQGRIGPHPVFPDAPGIGARRIADEADVDEVIALLRLNYDRVVARYGPPAAAAV